MYTEYEEGDYYSSNYKKKKRIIRNNTSSSSYTKLIIIFVVFIVIIVFAIILDTNPTIESNTYTSYENEMVNKAKEYVKNNNVMIMNKTYLDLNKLGLNVKENCSQLSGVIVDNAGNYKPYLSCNDYETNIMNNDTSVVDLSGKQVIFLPTGISYVEPGVSKGKYFTNSQVGTKEGVYELKYTVVYNNTQYNLGRMVVVTNSGMVRSMYPTIQLNGNTFEYVIRGKEFVDKKAAARDSIDGDISYKVRVEGTVNNSVVGEYKLKYIVTNSKGNTNAITRTVNVISENSDLIVNYEISPQEKTNKEVKILLNTSTDFDHIVYPDGSSGKTLEYTVTDNGTYKFVFYDLKGRTFEKEVIIDNIEKTLPEGNCTATLYFDHTDVKVTITNNREISTYKYYLNGKVSKDMQTNTYSSKTTSPTSVKVKVIDIYNNKNEITCKLVKNYTRKEYTDSKGKKCLEGYVCYNQGDYWNDAQYPYCSKEGLCGSIAVRGCSITSVTIAISGFNKKSKDGNIYTPYTLYDEAYPINKRTGECGGGCSGWTSIRTAAINVGLTAPRKAIELNSSTAKTLTDHLKKGYPAVVWAKGEPYAGNSAHYMAVIGIREDGYVFLSNPGLREGIEEAHYAGRTWYANTWIPVSDLIAGNVKYFLPIGPAGMYEGR